MSVRDSDRGRVYAVEAMVHNMFDAPGRRVEIAGTALTLPPEARFASIESVGGYVAKVLDLPAVRSGFARAAMPVSVRARRGSRSAHYEESGVIAIPDSREGRWALRELVILHEVAHHLDGSGDPSHGPEFVEVLIDLVSAVLGPEAGFVYRVLLREEGL